MKKALIKRVAKGHKTGQFRFTLVGKNGEVVAQSGTETYTTKAMCLKTLRTYFGDFEVVDTTKK